MGKVRARPTAAVLDGRTPRSTPESGGRAGSDGAKRRNGSEVHAAAGTLGHVLALRVTAADDQERAQVADPPARLREVTGGTVGVAFVDPGDTGGAPAAAARASGITPEVVRHAEAKRGFVLPPRRWVVERSFAWVGRFRRVARDDERRAGVVAGRHWLAFLTLLLLLPRLGLESA